MKPYFCQGSYVINPLYLVLRVAYDYLETDASVIGNTTWMSGLKITEKELLPIQCRILGPSDYTDYVCYHNHKPVCCNEIGNYYSIRTSNKNVRINKPFPMYVQYIMQMSC